MFTVNERLEKLPRCFLALNGVLPAAKTIERIWALSQFKLATDGAFQNLQSYGYFPDLVLGDMDSILLPKNPLPKTEFQKIEDQETTDSEKALLFLQKKKWEYADVVGVLGARLDHSWNHFLLLKQAAEKKLELFFWTDEGVCFLAKESFQIQNAKGRLLSFFAYPGEGLKNCKTSGLEYNFHGENLNFLKTKSISNRILFENAQVQFEKGCSLVFLGVGEGKF